MAHDLLQGSDEWLDGVLAGEISPSPAALATELEMAMQARLADAPHPDATEAAEASFRAVMDRLEGAADARRAAGVIAMVALLLLPPGVAQAQGVGHAVKLEGAALAAASSPVPPRRLGLFIGIERFDHSVFHALAYPTADAKSLASAYAQDGLVDPEDVVVITGADAPVTRARILEALEALARRNTRRDDVVFVGISTHGTLGRGDDGGVDQVLVTQDTRPFDDVYSSGVPVTELLERLAAFRSQRRVTLIAACNAGLGMSEGMQETWRRTKAVQAAPVVRASDATVTLFAAGPHQVAVEDAALGHDVYVHYFVQAMDDGDLNGDGAITVTEAHWSAAAKTFDHTSDNQLPQIRIDATGLDPIYLRNSPTERGLPVIWSYEPDEAWLTLLVDGQAKGRFPGPIAVQPGVRRLELQARPGVSPFASVTTVVGPGERLELGSVFAATWGLGLRGGARVPLGARGGNLGGATPALALSLRRGDPHWAGWGLTVDAAFEASDQRTPEGGAFGRQSAALTLGATRRLGAVGPIEAFAEAGLGALVLVRDLEGGAPERGLGPVARAAAGLRWPLGRSLDLEVAAQGRTTVLDSLQRGPVLVPEVGLGAGVSYRWLGAVGGD